MVSLEPKKQKRQNLHYPFSPKSSHSTYQSRMTVLAEIRPERTCDFSVAKHGNASTSCRSIMGDVQRLLFKPMA